MSHSIQISDELWDAYEGSPMAMRDALMKGVLDRAVQREQVDQPPPERQDKGTIITVTMLTNCNGCRNLLDIGDRALYRSELIDGHRLVKRMYCTDCMRDLLPRAGQGNA